MRIAPPYLLITVVQQPRTSSPPSQLKRSSTGVIWMCRASFTNSSCPLLWSGMVVSSQWIGSWFSLTCSDTADFYIIPLLQASRVPSVSSPISVWSLWLQLHGIQYTMLYCLPRGNVSFTLVNIERRVCGCNE